MQNHLKQPLRSTQTIRHRFLRLKALKIEYAFAFIFLTGASLFALITPPGQNPDEVTHFNRIIQLSSFNIFSEVQSTNNTKQIGGQIPTNVELFFKLHGIDYKLDKQHKFLPLNNPEANQLKFNDLNHFVDFRGAALYSPVAYINIIPGLIAAKAANFPISATFYLLRLISILSVFTLLYLSIKHIPVGKWLIFCVALIPSVISQSAAISADGIVIGTTILFISYIYKISLEKKQLSRLQYLNIGILILAIGLVKITYIPIVALVAIIPLFNKNMRRFKPMFGLFVALVIPFVISLLWMKSTGYIDSNYGLGADISAQKSYILSSPFSYMHTLLVTFFADQNPGTVAYVWLGVFGNFGYLTAPLPVFAVFLLIICLVQSVSLKSKRELTPPMKIKVLWWYRLLLLSISAVTVVVISTALYLYFTPLKSPVIEGLQGRYFIPVLPLLLILFYGNVYKKQSSIKISIVAIYIFVTLVAVLAAYFRYY